MRDITSDTIKIIGTITARLFDKDGNLKQESVTQNVITNTGRQLIIDRLQASGVAVPDYIAIGSGATAPAAADTAMQTELARAQATLSQPDAHTDRAVYTSPRGRARARSRRRAD
jgi:hypothetical protein